MADRMLAGGIETIGTFTPIQLYAGERSVVTTQGTVAAGQKIGLLNSRGETYKFGIVALVGGKFVKWNQAATDGSEIIAGVLPHAMDTTATGYNADTDSPVIKDAALNVEAMDLGAVTAAQVRAARQGPAVNITFQRLY